MTILFGNSRRTSEPQLFTRPVGKVDPVTEAEMLNIMTGGVTVPPNVDWTSMAFNGTGKAEVRLLNGWVQFRGDVKFSQSAVGSYAEVVKNFPAGIPRPNVDMNIATWAIETGVTYRIGLVRIGASGSALGVSAPTGKFDTFTINGISYQVF